MLRIRSTFSAACAAILAAVTLQADADTLQVQNPRDPSLCMTASLGSVYWEKCNPAADNQRLPYSTQAGPTKPPVVLPTDPPASTPTTPVDPPKADPEPSGTPSTDAVPFFSTNWPEGIDPKEKPHWGPYPTKSIGEGSCISNGWAFSGTLAGARQSMGCRAASNGGVDMRFEIKADKASNKEVASFPSYVFGKTPSGTPASNTTKLPRRISDLKAASISYQSADGSFTYGQFTTDIWVTTQGGCAGPGCRKIEIMWQFQNFGGYNTPAPWSKGGPGRSGASLGDGPNERATYERTTIGGVLVDVYDYEPGTWGEGWRMVKLFPVALPGPKGGAVDVMAVLNYLKGKGRLTPADYVGAIEVGWEPVVTKTNVRGGHTVRGLKVQVQ